MSASEKLIQDLENGDNADIRGPVFTLPRTSSREEQTLFKHQVETLARLDRNRGCSGIIHLPTGAGKTRIGLEIAARRLNADPNERVIWATHSLTLIRQGMVRLVELASLFPSRTKFQWIRSGSDDPDLLDRAHITFCSQGDLRRLLNRGADGRVAESPLHFLVESDEHPRVTLIYDECHQLGAAKLQTAWRKMERARVSRKLGDWSGRFQTIGLSATPLPTDIDAHRLLKSTVFPLQGGQTVKEDWGMLVHASIDNEQLVRAQILCPINLSVQKTGVFDIPRELFRRAIGTKVSISGRPTKTELIEFSVHFNKAVMGDDGVLKFLADRLSENLARLGKTLVFVPTIDAANRRVRYLKARLEPGKVSVVHSRLDELEEGEATDLEDETTSFADVQKQISAFKARGSEPCIMVNVGMLTTGFDDPQIRTVVLGRLTFSTNLFWQMIGRGTRGLKCRGTRDCNVIDPIRLTDRFDFLQGYRPQLEGEDAYAKLEQQDLGDDALDPRVKAVTRAPVTPDMKPDISPLLRADVVAALREFLKTGLLDASLCADVAVRTSAVDGLVTVECVPNTAASRRDASVDHSGATFFGRQVALLTLELERKLGVPVDLTWMECYYPSTTSELDVEVFNEILSLAHKKATHTEEAFKRAQVEAMRNHA